ncbi:hypothetical protein [Amycolatopsis taiwanensis]|uniref:hypothetical protein n=1 Tax=Amycolatopsis taiwanensis TaxID=342230 RepID=UPI0004862B15|nr:hypothetical protein [Amycolatopsis taiwanensis]
MNTGAATARDILDNGAAGLDFFASFVPAYNRCVRAGLAGAGAKELNYQRDFADPFYTPDATNFSRLRAEADRVEAGRRALLDGAGRLAAYHEDLKNLWQGGSAESASMRCGALGQKVHAAAGNLADVAAGLRAAAACVERSCREKAHAVQALAADEVAGLGADAVELMAGVATGRPAVAELQRAAAFAGIAIGGRALERLPIDYREALQADIASWLANGFVPVFEARKNAFESACERARSQSDGAWTELDGTLAQFNPASGSSTVDSRDSHSGVAEQATGFPGESGLMFTALGGLGLTTSRDRDRPRPNRVPISESVADDVAEPSDADDVLADEPGVEESGVEEQAVATAGRTEPAAVAPQSELDELELLDELDRLPEPGSPPVASEFEDLLEVIMEEDR